MKNQQKQMFIQSANFQLSYHVLLFCPFLRLAHKYRANLSLPSFSTFWGNLENLGYLLILTKNLR